MTLTHGASPEVSVHFIGDGSLLFHAGRQELYEANTTATYIWCCLAEGLDPEQAAQSLSHEFALDRSLADSYVAQILREWSDRNLLDNGSVDEDFFFNHLEPFPAYQAPIDPKSLANAVFQGGDYRLLDSLFRVAYADRPLYDWIHPVIGHLACAEMTNQPDRTYRVAWHGDHILLLEDGLPVCDAQSLDAIAPAVKGHMVVRALQNSAGLCAIHAGALLRGGRYLLMPGKSGHGKSTLTAALSARGFDLLGDDTTVLAKGDLSARAVPMGVCVKQGSWELLRPYYPQIDDLAIHHRCDDKIVRYLLPEGVAARPRPEQSWPVSWIVFPNYQPDAETRLTPMAPADALRRLMIGFCPIFGKLTAEEIAQLVQWIEGIACYELNLSGLDHAITLLEDLCQ